MTTAVRNEDLGSDAAITPGLLEVADLTIEELGRLLDPESPRRRVTGSVVVDVPTSLAHVRTAAQEAVVEAGGRVVVSEWPALWTGAAGPIGPQLRPPVRAAIVGAGDHRVLERYRRQATVPIVNAGSDRHDPLGVLADLLTIRELLGRLRGVSVAFAGGPSPYRTSLVQAAVRTGVDLVLCRQFADGALAAEFEAAQPFAQLFGSQLLLVDPTREVVTVDVVIGDPTPFALLATTVHLPVDRTGAAADSGGAMAVPLRAGDLGLSARLVPSAIEGPRALLFHRQECLRRLIRQVLTLA